MRRMAPSRRYRPLPQPGFGQEPDDNSVAEDVIEQDVVPRVVAILAGIVSGATLLGVTAYAIYDWSRDR